MATKTTTPETETAFEPKVKIENIGPCRKKVTIEVPADAVRAELSGSFDALSTQVSVPGFRPGKAPRKLVERMFGKAARDEAKKKLVADAYKKAIESNKLSVLGEPEGGDELEGLVIDPAKPISFTIEVEVSPEFKLPSIDGVPVKKPKYEPTEAMIDEEIERLQVHEGDLESREKAEPGDYCTGLGVIADKKGETVLEIDGAVIQVPAKDDDGRGAIMGVMVDDFAKQVGAPKPGDTLTIKATGPENHETLAIRGEPITITFEVQRVDRIIPIEVDALCERLGMPDAQRLREAVTLRLNHRVMVRQQSVMRRQIADYLLENVELELPEKLTERQAERNLARRRMDLMHRGVNTVKIEEQVAEMRAASSEVAQRELKLFFILDRIAREKGVQVTEGEVGSRITQIAQERGERPEKVRDALVSSGQANFLVQQIREHKAMDAILAKAAIEEVDGETFDEQDGVADAKTAKGDAKSKKKKK